MVSGRFGQRRVLSSSKHSGRLLLDRRCNKHGGGIRKGAAIRARESHLNAIVTPLPATVMVVAADTVFVLEVSALLW
jgi:hypothetical protein